MTALHTNAISGTLRREVGVFGATMMGLGAIIGTGIFVSVGYAIREAGDWIVVAIGVAAVVATLNGLSSAQLAAAHPVSGGTYEYGYRWLHPSLGFTAGWMFLCAKSASAATAALGFASYGLRLFQVEADSFKVPIGLVLLVVVMGIVLLGVRWSSIFNASVVTVTLTALAIFIVIGLMTVWFAPDGKATLAGIGEARSDSHFMGILEACALMFVAYTGYGRIATLGEEIRNPRKNISIAIIFTLGVSMVLYLSVAWVSVNVVGAIAFEGGAVESGAPLEMVAKRFLIPQVSYLVGVGAVMSMLGVLINLVLGLSRVVLAMGRRRDLPEVFSRVDISGRAPTGAVLLVGGCIALLIVIGNGKTTWSFSAFTVLIYYSITNLAAIRMSDSERRYPSLLAWLGLFSCLFLAFWVEPSVWLVGVGLIGVGLLWWRIRKLQSC
ncbi:putative amino acid permease YhdG [Pirellula sp. SH-Sr6A]|uniref:APC family permease n=1 Tax=Pirellula sp. SH-Sr6A TaxID=1632865 RepID=UPI00078EC071|nr:APC family permease [Pirellula sp. SH-Sr6A]AMV35386.1 putative amino acid permease YhdG [Pirellula sp. SH-Sr6A]